jgi:hypothetical protein
MGIPCLEKGTHFLSCSERDEEILYLLLPLKERDRKGHIPYLKSSKNGRTLFNIFFTLAELVFSNYKPY